MAKQLTMGKSPEKMNVNNSGTKEIGVSLRLDQIEKAEPFTSLFDIHPEVLEAIRTDMKANGFDPSKPVNVWKTPEGKRILIDGYTRIRAAEELGLLHVTAYEKNFTNETEALAYAVHTQKDRRNLSDAELFRLLERIDNPQKGFKTALGESEKTPQYRRTHGRYCRDLSPQGRTFSRCPIRPRGSRRCPIWDEVYKPGGRRCEDETKKNRG